MMKVDEYNEHEFVNYYYNMDNNKFYLDTGMNYKELYVNHDKCNRAFVNTYDKNDDRVKIYYSKFKRLHDLI